jgi:hypothetical protein
MLDKLFLAHPRKAGESYLAHLRVALGISVSLLMASLAALIHALVPALFEKTASLTVHALNDRLSARKRN